MDDAGFGFASIVPPLAALALAIRTKQVHFSLLVAIWLGQTMIGDWSPLRGLVLSGDALVATFADDGRAKTILLSALIGAFLTFTQYSGGMAGFVSWLSERGWVTGRRSAGLLAWAIGTAMFIEANIGVYVSGPLSRPLFDRFRLSREKLAYVLDSTAASIATLVPINSWGAYLLSLIAAQGIAEPLPALVGSMPFNFYPILAVVLSLIVVWSGWDFSSMRRAEQRVRDEGKLLDDGAEPLVAAEVLMLETKVGVTPRASHMVVPVLAIVLTVLIVLFATGDGNPMRGDGTTSVFWAVIVSILTAAALYLARGVLALSELTECFMKGVGGLIPIVILLMLAFVLGDTCQQMGTGPYIAGAAEAGLPASVLPAALFLVSCLISFATGTSWGTWAIMFPIAIPMIELSGLHPGLTIGAILGGAIFGDHCSPISDSTIICSMAAGTDHIAHVRTQLPYAMSVASVSLIFYLALGSVL